MNGGIHHATTMRWRMVRDDLIESSAGYRILKGAADHFTVWGPNGTQDLSAIAQATADCLKTHFNVDRDPAKLQMQAGRALLGVYDDAEEARGACQSHSQALNA